MAEKTAVVARTEKQVSEDLDQKIKAAKETILGLEKKVADASVELDSARATLDALIEQRGRVRRISPAEAVRQYTQSQQKLREQRAGLR